MSSQNKELDSLSDGVLITEDGRKFKIHRNLLAFQCPFFKDLFFGDFSNGTCVILKGIDGKTLDNILVYLYTGSIHLSKDNAVDIIIASACFRIDSLLQESKSFIVRKLTPFNCIPLFLKVYRIRRLVIFNDFYRFIVIHFEEIASLSEEIGSMPLKAVKKILCDKNLNLSEERTAWNAINKWVNFDLPNRLRFIPELLSCINFEDADELLVNDIIHKLVRENLISRKLQSIEQYSAQLRYVRKILKSQSLMNGTRIPNYLNFIVQCCIEETGGGNNLYLTCDGEIEYWRKVDAVNFFPDCLIHLGRYVYMFDTSTDMSLAFDLIDEICSPMTPLSKSRISYSVVTGKGFIYAIGGVFDSIYFNGIKDIERYDPSTEKWEMLSSKVPMYLSEAVAMNGYIYAIGHVSCKPNSIMTVQRYDPVSDRWFSVSAPRYLGPEIAAVAFCGYLYLIGGKNAEEYDYRKDVWIPMPDLPVSYLLPKAIVPKDVLIVYEANLVHRSCGGNTPPVYWDSECETGHVIQESSPLHLIHMYKFCTIKESGVIKEIVKRKRNQKKQWDKSTLT